MIRYNSEYRQVRLINELGKEETVLVPKNPREVNDIERNVWGFLHLRNSLDCLNVNKNKNTYIGKRLTICEMLIA